MTVQKTHTESQLITSTPKKQVHLPQRGKFYMRLGTPDVS